MYIVIYACSYIWYMSYKVDTTVFCTYSHACKERGGWDDDDVTEL